MRRSEKGRGGLGRGGEARTRQVQGGRWGQVEGVEDDRGCKVQVGVWGRWGQWGGVERKVEKGREGEV